MISTLYRRLFMLSWLLLSLTFIWDQTLAAVVGIDYGSEYFKLASAPPGRSLDVILNVHSQRKTPTAISFANQFREFGESALGHLTKNPDIVITTLPLLLGQNITNIQHLVNEFQPLSLEVNEKLKKPSIHIPNKNISFTPEELSAQLFKAMHGDITMFFGNKPGIKLDVVVTVPSAFTMKQKVALFHAAKISDMHVLRLIGETEAASVYHAVNLPTNHTGETLFINIGSSKMEACVVNYNYSSLNLATRVRTIQAKGCASSFDIGGKHFDRDLTKSVISSAVKHFGKSSATKLMNSRMMQKFLMQANRVKLNLSTNKVTEFILEEALNDQDYRQQITRDEFEALIMPRLEKMIAVIDAALRTAKTNLTSLQSIEVIGGSSRIPKLQSRLSDIVKPHAVGFHLNSDEAPVLGAALLAVNSSSTFRLKPMRFSPVAHANYTFRVTSKNSNRQRKNTIVSAGNAWVEGLKTFTLKTCEDMSGQLLETFPDEPSTLLYEYDITGVEEKCQNEYKEYGTPKISFIFNVNSTGLVGLNRVAAQWEETYQVNGTVPKTEKTSLQNETNEKNDTDIKDDANSKKDNSTEASTEPPKVELITKTKKHTIICNVTTTEFPPLSMSYDDILESKTKLQNLMDSDEVLLKGFMLRNELEGLIYSTRSRLGEEQDLRMVTTEEFHLEARQNLDIYEDWLYSDEGLSASLTLMNDKLDSFKEFFQKAEHRASERKQREHVEEMVKQFIEGSVNLFLPLIGKEIEVSDAVVSSFNSSLTEFMDWYNQQKDKQRDVLLIEEPAYLVEEVKKKLVVVSQKFQNIVTMSRKITPQVVNATDGASDMPEQNTENITILDKENASNKETTSNQSSFNETLPSEATPETDKAETHDEL